MRRAWTCALHNVTTTGDCPKCDDELIALAEDAQRGCPECDWDGFARDECSWCGAAVIPTAEVEA